MVAATVLLLSVLRPIPANQTIITLPNTSGIDGQLTANLGVDHFFSLWIVFNNDDVQISDESFTILAPKNTAIIEDDGLLHHPELVRKLLMDHVVLGPHLDVDNVTSERSVTTLGGRTFTLSPAKEGKLRANGANILETKLIRPNGLLVVLDNYLFPDDLELKRNKTKTSVVGMIDVVNVKEERKTKTSNATFIENIMQVLSLLKSGVRVFQHFLSRSNVSKLLTDDEEYTVFVPTDHAFQRWHPIDWGFYPFSVPEFTESVIINHFVKGNLKQDNIKSGHVAKTLGGREVVFKKAQNLTVNGASVVKGDTPLPKGNIMFISEVLFVSESVVSRLHQQHRDKETPPLLAFPWFGAQFLSHAFLALERDRRFSHITRFLNLADLAPHVSGTGYTFFVPTDTAFEELGLDKMPDNYLSTGEGLEILLNHFVKGRLYDRDLKDNTTLTTLGNKTIHVRRSKENVTINKADIVESEVFVYNLGTMFYIDKVLFANTEFLSLTKAAPLETTTPVLATTTVAQKFTTKEVEAVPEELTETGGSLPDVLFADAEFKNDTTDVPESTTNSDANSIRIK